jgi:hypothetical protein
MLFVFQPGAVLAAEPALSAKAVAQSYDQIVAERLQEGLQYIQNDPWPSPKTNVAQSSRMALLLLNKNEKVKEAGQLILNECGSPLTEYVGKTVPRLRSEALFRIYLQAKTHRLLSKEARTAIEDYAWNLLTKHNRGITRVDADKSFWEFGSSENHYLNDRRRYTQALQVLRMADRYGPDALLEGQTIDSHHQTWVAFWIRYFRDRAGEGVDLEVAHHSSYGLCTVGVYYDLHDLTDSAELRELAAKFLTLYWAEVASEFEPRTGQRAWAATRYPNYDGHSPYWAQALLYCYGWHDGGYENQFLGNVPFLVSSYRPPEILRAIARDTNRGAYLSTSRRAGLIRGEEEKGEIIFDHNGDSHFRRDVYYTPEYTLSTMTLDPSRHYDQVITLAQTMGVTFASDVHARITVMGTGYYPRRAINGITGAGVSIIARDPNATPGRDRFKSDGTRVFIRKGELWDNRVEDASGWFFTHAGDAYVAVRIADQGYHVTTKTYTWPNRQLKEVEERNGHFLELNDMWAPVLIQMGRAADYASFEAFQASANDNEFSFENGKLRYVSEASDTYEYWAKGAERPRINGADVNLNPHKTYDSPYLSMVHGEDEAVITFPGHEDLVLEFSRNMSSPQR